MTLLLSALGPGVLQRGRVRNLRKGMETMGVLQFHSDWSLVDKEGNTDVKCLLAIYFHNNLGRFCLAEDMT